MGTLVVTRGDVPEFGATVAPICSSLENSTLGTLPMTRNRHSGYSRMLSRRSFAPIAASILVVLAGCKEGGSTEPKNGPGPTSITLDPNALTVSVGQAGKIYATVRDQNGTRLPNYSAVTWTSANSSVASVAKSDTTGVVTGLAVGETQVLATVGNVIAHISVNVVP
jgi:uncharacterized protein YjdB